MLGVGFTPFFNAKRHVIGILFGISGTFPFGQFCPACRIGQYWMFNKILSYRLYKWIVANRLNEYRAIVMFWRGGDINLQ